MRTKSLLHAAEALLLAVVLTSSARASEPITEFPIPTSQSGPAGITRGPDGNVWFCEGDGNKIGRITPGGTISEFPTSFPPLHITTGPDGNVWYAADDFDIGGAIGRVSPAGEVKEFPVSGEPGEIVSGGSAADPT